MRLWALILSIAVIFGATPAPAADWRSSGSGFYLMGTRHIMTSLHVVAEAGEIRVSFPSGETYRGRIVSRDSNNDIAVLALEGMPQRKGGFRLNFGADVGPGDKVFAIGYPQNADITLSPGEVSSATGLNRNAAQFTMTAPINPGSSGGPVIDDFGNLVGIALSGYVKEGFEARRFASRISTAATAIRRADLKTRRFSIRVAKKQKRLTSRAIFKKFHRYVVKIEVQEVGPGPVAGAPAPPTSGSTDLATLQREVEAEERRLKEAEKARSLRERLARLRKRRERLEARPKPPARPAPRREATYMPGPKRYPKTITGKDGAPMVHVPAGWFIMGSNLGDSDEKPQRRVYLDGFYIDKYEVTNARFRAAGMTPRKTYGINFNGDTQPVVGVTWHQAKAYCEKVGKRLPTEAEWEKAARGTDGRKYPWGNSYDASKLIYWRNSGNKTHPVDRSYSTHTSPYGAVDMAGNVWEWVNDRLGKNYYRSAPEKNPQGPDAGSERVLRGGGWSFSDRGDFRAAYRGRTNPTRTGDIVGFRCAQALGRQASLPKKEKGPEPKSLRQATFMPGPKRYPKTITGKDGAPMVHVPAGWFIMGSNSYDEKPRRRVYLDGFYIDKYEVTNARFRAAGMTPKQDYGSKFGGSSQPVVGVTWHQAKAHCEKAGKRLPTEAEWEKAARGTDGRKYPWGNSWDASKLIYGHNSGSKTHPTDRTNNTHASPYGAADMAGNVWEWVQDWYDASYYQNAPERNPKGVDAGSRRVLRGGSWDYNYFPWYFRAADRFRSDPNGWNDLIGFRCAKASG